MKVIPILAFAAIIIVAILCIPSLINGGQDLPEGDDEDVEEETENSFSAQIVINNPEWGNVIVQSFNSSSVIYKAVPKEGYHFEYWMNSRGQYIPDELGNYHSSTITYDRLDKVKTTAIFQEGEVDYGSMLTYYWEAPVYYAGGDYGSEQASFTATLTESQYEEAQSLDVHRRAVAGNTYITPWELCVEDEAVEQCVTYLDDRTEGQTDLQKAMTILWFVQDIISYKTDSAQYGTTEYWASPLETLYSGKGDCEDTAILFCSISAKMGLDCGLIGFSYSDTARKSMGHMGCAVALTNGASVQNATTFTMDGITYVYCETATDQRIDMGYLAYDPTINAYHISDGTWTRITYDPFTGYGHEPTVNIGSNSNSGVAIYGDNSEPPIVNLTVGDSFSYEPATSLQSTITASGNGLTSEGGFLVFRDGILSGTPDRAGQYSVTLTAYWTNGQLEQTATQLIKFSVSEASASYSGEMKQLTYGDGGWDILTTQSDIDEDDNTRSNMGLYIGGAVAVIILFLVARRFI